MRYCLAMEYAEHGDLGAFLVREGAQSERFVRREIAGLARALDVLHRGQAMHRDLTPFNVFVCEGNRLKLGDFGIATHQRSARGVTADAFNLMHAPNEIAWGKVRRWQKRDDVYQIGLIAGLLLDGDIRAPMRSKDVRGLPCRGRPSNLPSNRSRPTPAKVVAPSKQFASSYRLIRRCTLSSRNSRRTHSVTGRMLANPFGGLMPCSTSAFARPAFGIGCNFRNIYDGPHEERRNPALASCPDLSRHLPLIQMKVSALDENVSSVPAVSRVAHQPSHTRTGAI